jgi:hypothetical protein
VRSGAPPQHERTPYLMAHPISDRTAEQRPQNAGYDDLPKFHMSLLNQEAGNHEDSLCGEWHSGTLQQRTEKDNCPAVLFDQGEHFFCWQDLSILLLL